MYDQTLAIVAPFLSSTRVGVITVVRGESTIDHGVL